MQSQVDPASALSAPSARPASVLVIDADRRVRRSLSCLIDLADGLHCCGVAEDEASALAVLASAEPDICVIDPDLQGHEGMQTLLAHLREVDPGVAIVAMSSSDSIGEECLSCGVDAFVAKAGQPEEMVETLRRVAARSRDEA